MADTQMLFDPLEKQFDLPAPLVERRDGQGARRKMISYKDQSFAGFRIDQTDAEQMLRIIPPRVETVKDDGLIEAQTCHFVDGARINPVIVHVDFGARDQEGAGLMEHTEPAKIDIAAIHHIDRSGLGDDQIEGYTASPILPCETWIKLGIGPRRSSSVCIFTAALVERKSAHGNRDRHRSIVVLSSA